MNKYKNAGFTLPELIIVLAIFALLISLSAISLLRSQQKTTLSSQVNTLISDIRSQQFNALSSDTASGTSQIPYSIYFADDAYILFPGSTYVPQSPSNFSIDLSDVAQFTNITLPNRTVTFVPVSGELKEYTPGANHISIQSKASNEVKTIYFNAYGVVERVE